MLAILMLIVGLVLIWVPGWGWVGAIWICCGAALIAMDR